MTVREEFWPWDSQPQVAPQLAPDLGDPELLVVPSLGFVNLADGQAGTVNNAANLSLAPGPLGFDIGGTLGTTAGVYWPVASRSTSQPWTLLSYFHCPVAQTQATSGLLQIATTSASSGSPWLLLATNSVGNLRLYVNNTYVYSSSDNLLPAGAELRVAISYDGANVRIVLNGLLLNTYAAASLGATAGTHLWVANGFPSSGSVRHFFTAYTLQATPLARLIEITEDRWAALEPRRVWVPKTAGAGGYTLTAESGSYALTGQTAGLLATRTVVAEQGSYALNGQTATLTKGTNLVAEQGSYALSGQTVILLAAPQLVAEQGSYVLTGQDATLTYAPSGAYTLTAESGGYALTGQDAALRLARFLVAAQGSYTLTGQDATFSSGKILLVGQGSYALTGQDAAFRRTYALAAGFGSYTLTGQAATLTYSAGIVAILEQVRLRSRITQAIDASSRITQQLSLRSQVRH